MRYALADVKDTQRGTAIMEYAEKIDHSSREMMKNLLLKLIRIIIVRSCVTNAIQTRAREICSIIVNRHQRDDVCLLGLSAS